MLTHAKESVKKMKEELSYRNLFNIFLEHGSRTSLEFKTDGEIKEIAFNETEFPVKYAADNLIEMLNSCEKGFVGLKVDNCPEWPIIFWGILMAGFKPFLIDYRHNEQLTEFLLKQTAAVALISEDKDTNYEGVISVNANDVITLDRRKIYELAKAGNVDGNHRERTYKYVWGDEVALCTSGTTSTAKIYTYNGNAIGSQVLTGLDVVEQNIRIASDKKTKNLAFLPFHHIFGFLAVYIWYSFFQSAIVFPEGKAPSLLLATCREHNVTHILAVPLLINNIVAGINRKLAKGSKFKRVMFKSMCGISLFAQKISPEGGVRLAKKMFKKSVLDSLVGTSMEVIVSGGGHVLPSTLKTINAIGYYTLCGFGMTEVGISSLNYEYSVKSRNTGCVGLPVKSIDYRVIPIDLNKPNVGELQIRGSSIHSGRMLEGKELPPDTDPDGWFATGDIGRLHKGALYIEGRLKEVIINESGENVYPDELEDFFMNMEGINQYTIVGIQKEPNSPYESITLVMETSNDLNDEEFKNKLIETVNSRNKQIGMILKRVTNVLITNEALPLANGIKVKRAEIKKQVESGKTNKYIKLK